MTDRQGAGRAGARPNTVKGAGFKGAAFKGAAFQGALGVCLGAAQAEARAAEAPAAPPAPEVADAAKEVVVTGTRPLQGDKLPVRLLDTPQSVTVVPEALLVAQGATRLEDALRNVPGITLNAGEGAARGDTVNLRGFSAFNDFFLDGVRDAAVYTRDSFDLQTLEVLKGPSATLFGRGSTGGVINQVSKAATQTRLAVMSAETGTNDEANGLNVFGEINFFVQLD